MKKLAIAAIASVASAPAYAAGCVPMASNNFCAATAVPEISALEGTAAVAALAAIVLFAWERRRRAV